MEIPKRPRFVLLRWIGVLPAVALLIVLDYLLFQRIVTDETRNGNGITALIASFVWAASTVYIPIGMGMSIVPFYKKITGVIVGVLVASSFILLFIYLGRMNGFTPMVIAKIIGFVMGSIGAYLVFKKGDMDLETDSLPESSGDGINK